MHVRGLGNDSKEMGDGEDADVNIEVHAISAL